MERDFAQNNPSLDAPNCPALTSRLVLLITPNPTYSYTKKILTQKGERI